MSKPVDYFSAKHSRDGLTSLHAEASAEHIWLLRAEGLKLREIMVRMGHGSTSVAGQSIRRYGRRVSRAIKRARFRKDA